MGLRSKPSGAVSAEEVERRLVGVKMDAAETDAALRKVLGYGALGLMAAQIVIADAAFFVYGFTNHWDVPVSAINVWLAATVVQVAFVVRTVARYLFPLRGTDVVEEPETFERLGGARGTD
jgi:hypothetical protein